MRKKAKENSIWKEEEYVKSAAWAWYMHRSEASCKFIKESDAHATVKGRTRGGGGGAGPSRFQLEAMGLLSNNSLQREKLSVLLKRDDRRIESYERSLFDSYEIEALSRQLETTFSGPISSNIEKSTAHNRKSWTHTLGHLLLIGQGSYPSPKEGPIWRRSLSKFKKVKKSCTDSMVSNADVLHRSYKNEGSNSSRVRSRQLPIMCSLTDVVVPARSSHHTANKVESERRLHG